MGRKKIKNKHGIVSVSLPQHQLLFIKEHNVFDLSKFVQLFLDDYINNIIAWEEIKYDKKTTK